MLVRGERAPIVGRICMDLTMLDVGHISCVSMEDEVVVFGRQNGAFLSVDELAERIRTINYEIVSNLNPRVKRIYLPA
jgi:alanine racemase